MDKDPPEVLNSDLITSTEPENVENTVVSVYPNPTTPDNINIEMASDSQHPAYLSIIGNTGSLFYDKMISSAELQDGFKLLGLNKLQTGFYIIIIEQDNIVVTNKNHYQVI